MPAVYSQTKQGRDQRTKQKAALNANNTAEQDRKNAYTSSGTKEVTGDYNLDRMLGERPKYQGIRDSGGNLMGQYSASTQKSNISGLDSRLDKAKDVDASKYAVQTGENFKAAQDNIKKLEGRAFGTGPSDWAKARMSLADSQNQEARNQLATDSKRALQGNLNAMAQQGGLEGGSRERMMGQAAKNKMMSSQAMARQNLQAKLGISADDEAQRLQLQQSLPGMNLQADSYSTGLQSRNADRNLQGDQFNSQLAMSKANLWGDMANSEAGRNQQVELFNKGNAINDVNNQQNYNLGGWQSTMDAYGASETSKAQAKAARAQQGGGLLGLGTPIL